MSPEEIQEERSGNGIRCGFLLSLEACGMIALLWHLLLKLWFKAIIGAILAIFRLELYIMVLGYKKNLPPDLTC